MKRRELLGATATLFLCHSLASAAEGMRRVGYLSAGSPITDDSPTSGPVIEGLKRLGWVEVTEETQPSAIQDNYPPAPSRTYYRLTKSGVEAGDELWSNPLFILYPEIGSSHMKKSR